MLNIIVAPYEVCENAEKYTMRIVKLLKKENEEYAVYFSHTLDDLDKNVRELCEAGENEFVVVGDDRVISHFINAVKDISKVKFGIIPTSKNDDFSSYLGISDNPLQAIKDILTRNIEPTDYLLVNDRKVFNNILIGASVEIFEMYNQFKAKNFFTKKYVISKYGNKFDGIELSFSSKGKNFDVESENIFELSISNAGLSEGKNVSPLSNVNDGLFNLNFYAIHDKQDKKKYLRLFKKGDQIYTEETKQFWLNNLKITNPDDKIKAVVDARLETFEKLDISIVENGLKIYKAKN